MIPLTNRDVILDLFLSLPFLGSEAKIEALVMPPRRTKKETVPQSKRTVQANSNTNGNGSNAATRGAAPKRTVKPVPGARLRDLLSAHPVDDLQNQTEASLHKPRGSGLGSIQRLSTILHGAFLVTMAKKAQLRVSHTGANVTVTVDAEWLEAIVRYCGFTVLTRDIIECGAAFTAWLQVSVTAGPGGVAEEAPASHNTGTASLGGLKQLGEGVAAAAVVVKLRLLRESVPSVLEAEAHLKKRWGRTEAWRDTLFSAGLTTARETGEVDFRSNDDLSLNDGKTRGTMVHSTSDDDKSEGGGGVSDEELLAQISKELRASLSEDKLRAVVAQMRRESLGLEAKEQEKISRRQRQERLLSTYDLVRSILGEKRSVCNTAHILQQMAAQNRFGDDMDGALEQLASLARHKESGIVLFKLDDEPELLLPQQRNGEGGTAPSFTVREVDLCRCSTRELEAVLLRLDRHVASRAALHAALLQE
ncbi:hypothetical protein DQ04_00141270 [Trypanosoma grayi]|uniref:hypothetical protein n=1 Tax=Trypanosoma grayi TaxID=71804 RepID=UPI0004F49A36|nr:hypothetical protein DQ04_00141270 [Trypanosoma grayi]KEG15239.1 hypothetical protein DQ04_00141270 [Trypanosoma grayi]